MLNSDKFQHKSTSLQTIDRTTVRDKMNRTCTILKNYNFKTNKNMHTYRPLADIGAKDASTVLASFSTYFRDSRDISHVVQSIVCREAVCIEISSFRSIERNKISNDVVVQLKIKTCMHTLGVFILLNFNFPVLLSDLRSLIFDWPCATILS